MLEEYSPLGLDQAVGEAQPVQQVFDVSYENNTYSRYIRTSPVLQCDALKRSRAFAYAPLFLVQGPFQNR